MLQLPLVLSSREFVYLNVDRTRIVEEKLTADEPATALSYLDHYISRPTTREFESATLFHFVQHYTMPRQGGTILVSCTTHILTFSRINY